MKPSIAIGLFLVGFHGKRVWRFEASGHLAEYQWREGRRGDTAELVP
jgi:hypothetical protein